MPLHPIFGVAPEITIGASIANTFSAINTFSAQTRWAKGADIASASPLVLGTDGNYFDVTGTTGFSQITCTAGTLFMLQFDGALTMTDGASLDLAGANITTVAGDRGLFFATAANTAQLLEYKREGAAPLNIQPAFSVHKGTTNQTGVVADTDTLVTFSTEIYDTNSDFASNDFLPTVAGKYLFVAALETTTNADDGDIMQIILYKNGALFKRHIMTAGAVAIAGLAFAVMDDADGSTDNYQLYYRHSTVGDQTISGTIARTWFMGIRIGP